MKILFFSPHRSKNLETGEYLYKKGNLENDFYCRLREIYVLLIVLNSAIQRVFNLNDDVFNKQAFENLIQQLSEKSDFINQIDYTPLFQSNPVASVFKTYKTSVSPMLETLLHNFAYLDMAIYEDKISGNEAVIKILEKQLQEHSYSQDNKEEERELQKRGVKLSYSPKARKALSLLQHDINAIITDIDVCLQSLDEACEERYSWKNSKQYIQHMGETLSYDDYEMNGYLHSVAIKPYVLP